MKRVLALLLVLLMLSGCAQKGQEQTAPAPEEKPPVEEPETPVTAPAPAEKQENEPAQSAAPEEKQDENTAPAPQPAPEPQPEPEPESQPVSEQEPIPETEAMGVDWASYVAEAYTAITDHPEFNIVVWEPDDSRTDLVIRQGENDWNVDSMPSGFSEYQWTQITYEDVLEVTRTTGFAPTLVLWDVEGGMSLECQKPSGIVIVQDQTKITYLQAVDANGGNLYGLLETLAEDVIVHQVWDVAVDGSLTPEQAAKKMAEKVAENYKNMPDWIDWTPAKARREHTEVFDVYLGEPGEFCCNMSLEFKFDRPEEKNTIYLQAGAGLGEPDEDGYCSYFSQVHVRKNEEGDWAFLDRGTGGATVNPRWPAEKPWAEWLVEVFCLTEGQSHDWYIPGQILGLSEEEMKTLPAILDQLTEAESKDLCATLGRLLREQEGAHYYTVDTLKLLLGDYGHWLDA